MSSPSLLTCSCGGFVPAAAARCPHCSRTSQVGKLGLFARIAGASAFAVTMMACYGAMPRDGQYPGQMCDDADRDGSCMPQDCNDADATIFPGGADGDGDGIDQNCDGVDGWRDPDTVAVPPEPTPTPTPAP